MHVRIFIFENKVHYRGRENIHPYLVIVSSAKCLLTHKRKINTKVEKPLILLPIYRIHLSKYRANLSVCAHVDTYSVINKTMKFSNHSNLTGVGIKRHKKVK
jgi:hypothetical protein